MIDVVERSPQDREPHEPKVSIALDKVREPAYISPTTERLVGRSLGPCHPPVKGQSEAVSRSAPSWFDEELQGSPPRPEPREES